LSSAPHPWCGSAEMQASVYYESVSTLFRENLDV
jgi:hypothetical protein